MSVFTSRDANAPERSLPFRAPMLVPSLGGSEMRRLLFASN
jgi:hypothetical protein